MHSQKRWKPSIVNSFGDKAIAYQTAVCVCSSVIFIIVRIPARLDLSEPSSNSAHLFTLEWLYTQISSSNVNARTIIFFKLFSTSEFAAMSILDPFTIFTRACVYKVFLIVKKKWNRPRIHWNTFPTYWIHYWNSFQFQSIKIKTLGAKNKNTHFISQIMHRSPLHTRD